ncbi:MULTISPECIES: thermonuclease family protein [unclassified Thiocapsa]|uniref:thermonuclease family protein n=1 Tax=unclassified Thiocapsa TaxID=2641286 RepID=UPI0035B25121
MTTNVDLDVGHHRLVLFWGLAVFGLIAPWVIANIDWSALPFLEQPRQSCTVASIHDGDTLRAECHGEHLQVRLYCIDAPELAQRPWGPDSRDHLRRITPRTISLRLVDTDRYGRRVGEVLTTDGESLNLAMVSAGQAAVYPRYCRDQRFFAAERAARSGGLGIWSSPGDHQHPWDYRRGSN